MREEEVTVKRVHDDEKIETLLNNLNKTRTLCRENTRELLRTKKLSHAHCKNLVEEKSQMVENMNGMRQQLYNEQHRNEVVEKVVETRISKSQEKIVYALRSQCHKLEEEVQTLKVCFALT